jgi:hypothetical protein
MNNSIPNRDSSVLIISPDAIKLAPFPLIDANKRVLTAQRSIFFLQHADPYKTCFHAVAAPHNQRMVDEEIGNFSCEMKYPRYTHNTVYLRYTVLWTEKEYFYEYYEQYSLLMEIMYNLPPELIMLILTYEDRHNYYSQLISARNSRQDESMTNHSDDSSSVHPESISHDVESFKCLVDNLTEDSKDSTSLNYGTDFVDRHFGNEFASSYVNFQDEKSQNWASKMPNSASRAQNWASKMPNSASRAQNWKNNQDEKLRLFLMNNQIIDVTEIRPEEPNCQVRLCTIPCLLCIGCDNMLANCNYQARHQSYDYNISGCAKYCIYCGCIGYCRDPCRYCASCTEMPYEYNNWWWINSSDETRQWYKNNCCQCHFNLPMPPPHLNYMNRHLFI